MNGISIFHTDRDGKLRMNAPTGLSSLEVNVEYDYNDGYAFLMMG